MDTRVALVLPTGHNKPLPLLNALLFPEMTLGHFFPSFPLIIARKKIGLLRVVVQNGYRGLMQPTPYFKKIF